MLSDKTIRKFQRLIVKYQRGTASPREKEFVESYYKYFDTKNPSGTELSETEKKELEDRIYENLREKIRPASQGRTIVGFFRSRTYARTAAAAILVFLAGGFYWYVKKGKPEPLVKTEAPGIADISPGRERAVLTLANGTTIVLDSSRNGSLARQGNAEVFKRNTGEIEYQPSGKTSEVFYNTMSTQRGGQYRLLLPDGTKVRLNSSSSIHYPTAFTGSERRVEISGEVYFEVAAAFRTGSRAKIPFIVHVNHGEATGSPAGGRGSDVGGIDIRVLGTRFNIMAYHDEKDIKTTLLEGSVRITDHGKEVLLQPGQQAVTAGNSAAIQVQEADTDKETAWLTGFFQFSNTDLAGLMRQLQRWYDVEPVYLAKENGTRFGGRISMQLRLPEVLHLLEKTNIHFKIEGRKIIVMP